MVQHCFNAACRQEFQLLHAGDLYAMERKSGDTEFFWLCSDCASRFELRLNFSGFVTLSDVRASRATRRPSAESELHLISRCARPAPRLDSRPTGERHYAFMHGAESHFSGHRTRRWSATWDDEPALNKYSPRTAA